MRVLSLLISVFLLTALGGCNSNNTEEEVSQPSVTIEPTAESLTPERSPELAEDEAEAFYQELLAQHGENYHECLQPVEIELREAEKPDGFGESAPPSPKQLNVLVALDSSGSMAESVSGGQKIDIAKSAIAQFVSGLPKAAKVGLTVFGHKGSNSAADKAASCAGIENIYPLAQLDKPQFTESVKSFQPTGYTPLAATLERLQQNLSAYDGADHQNVVYLVSDGIETCDGDPVAAAKKLHASNAKVIVNVIGFDVNNEAQRQLKAVAEAGGGKFFSARNAADLQDVFRNRLQETIEFSRYQTTNRIDQGRVSTIMSIAIGKFSTCVSINLGRESTAISLTLGRLSPDDPRRKYSQYVKQKLRTRHENIQDWRDRVVGELENRRDVTLEKLQQDLDEVTREFTENMGNTNSP
ncbi:uncharacterized protein containing a von Willebrand factor type A (vWA) domain [Pleurocapsa sp. PCC 7327]|nr:uncharacterized protein containing a von Willebrand factor type A (vWA) domain [Pleurocapsa sp. PCC 7327]